jgi:hypothetical protein
MPMVMRKSSLAQHRISHSGGFYYDCDGRNKHQIIASWLWFHIFVLAN